MTKATRDHLAKAYWHLAAVARTTAGDERAKGRRLSADAYVEAAASLALLARASSQEVRILWQEPLFGPDRPSSADVDAVFRDDNRLWRG